MPGIVGPQGTAGGRAGSHYLAGPAGSRSEAENGTLAGRVGKRTSAVRAPHQMARARVDAIGDAVAVALDVARRVHDAAGRHDTGGQAVAHAHAGTGPDAPDQASGARGAEPSRRSRSREPCRMPSRQRIPPLPVAQTEQRLPSADLSHWTILGFDCHTGQYRLLLDRRSGRSGTGAGFGGQAGGGGGTGMFRAAMPASMAATTDSTTFTLAHRLSSASTSTQGAAA